MTNRKYLVTNTFTVKTSSVEKAIEAGQIIAISEDKASTLIEAGKITPLRTVFKNLFHAHMQKMKAHHLTADEIKARDPKTYRDIQYAIKEMDAAWLREDLPGFKTVMNRTENLYFDVMRILNQKKI